MAAENLYATMYRATGNALSAALRGEPGEAHRQRKIADHAATEINRRYIEAYIRASEQVRQRLFGGRR
jgi:hypothetical protein